MANICETKKFIDDYKGPCDKICSVVVKCIKVKEQYKVFIALHKKDEDVYGTGIRQIDPEIQDVQFHGSDHLSVDPMTSPSHGYGTMCESLEKDFGLDVFKDLIADKFDRSMAFNKINVWIHCMYKKASDSQKLRFFLLSDIIGLGEKDYSLESLDHNGRKARCNVDHETISLIKHVHSLGLLDWVNDPRQWL